MLEAVEIIDRLGEFDTKLPVRIEDQDGNVYDVVDIDEDPDGIVIEVERT